MDEELLPPKPPRSERSSSEPIPGEDDYPMDLQLKVRYLPDPTAVRFPMLGDSFFSRDSFQQACLSATFAGCGYVMVNCEKSKSAFEKRCKHTDGSMCTGDNFRVRIELQDSGLW